MGFSAQKGTVGFQNLFGFPIIPKKFSLFPQTPPAPTLPNPPPAAHPPVLGSSTTDSALKAQRARAGSAEFTAGGTIGTTPQGIPTSSPGKTLLG